MRYIKSQQIYLQFLQMQQVLTICQTIRLHIFKIHLKQEKFL